MATYFRNHPKGIETIQITAMWVEEQAKRRGISLHAFVAGYCTLTALGVTSEEARASLQPLTPNAHMDYNLYAGCETKYVTWDAWFSRCLRNRISYFFHKHGSDGLYRCWAEWPLDIPEEPKRAA